MSAPLILACDTTQGACSAALYQDGILAAALEPMQKGHAEKLMPMLEHIVQEAGIEMSAIERLAVTHGPGSFTGVRVGLSAMRGLAVALRAKLKTYSTLEVMARAAPYDGPLLVAVDARREVFYGQSFAPNADGQLQAQNHPQALNAAAALALEPTRPLAAIGTGADILAPLDAGVTRLDKALWPDYPSAAILAEMAAADPDWDNLPLRGREAEPLYLRPPDAALPDPKKRIALVGSLADDS